MDVNGHLHSLASLSRVMESLDNSLDGLPKRSVLGSEERNHCLDAVANIRSDERERGIFDISFHLIST
jgi:hypothetical protein